MNPIRLLLPCFLACALSACSTNEGTMKAYLRCGLAASQLGQHRAVKQIYRAMGRFIADSHVVGGTRAVAFLGQEVRDDMNLFHKSADMKSLSFFKIYNSSFCQDMHNQGKAEVTWSYYLAYLFI